MSLAASVLVPTRNRVASLERTLRALCRQDVPPQDFEVVVVADGCTDGTRARVETFSAAYRLRCIEQPPTGAAAARNRGAAAATGRWLAFLDDDVEPEDGWLRAHLAGHGGRDDRVVVAPLATVMPERVRNFHLYIRGAWSEIYDRHADPGHRWRFCDLVAANFSIAAAGFRAVGGFDEGFPECAREDFELGARLVGRVTFVHAPAAAARHHELERKTVALKLTRARAEGRGDVLIGRRHPALRTMLPLAEFSRPRLGPGACLPMLALHRRAPSERIASALVHLLPFLERGHLDRRWHVLFLHLVEHAYLCGVADEVGGLPGLERFLAEAPPTAPVADVELPRIDLTRGLTAARRALDELRPAGVVLTHGARRIATVPPEPGVEPLAGRHLGAILDHRLEELGSDRATRLAAIRILRSEMRADRGERAPKGAPFPRGGPTTIAGDARASGAVSRTIPPALR